MTKTYWLSFVDEARPPGQRHPGVVIVQVTEADAAAVRRTLPPQAQPGAEWIAAALRRAWILGCNPGGTVASVELTQPPPAEWYDRLLSAADVHALERDMGEQRDDPP